MVIKVSNSAISCTYTNEDQTFYEAFKVLTKTLRNNKNSKGLLSNYELVQDSNADISSILYNKEFGSFKIDLILNNIRHIKHTIIKIQAIGDLKLVLMFRFFFMVSYT